MNNNLYSIKEIADYLQVSKTAVRNIIKENNIVAVGTRDRGTKLFSENQKEEIVSCFGRIHFNEPLETTANQTANHRELDCEPDREPLETTANQTANHREPPETTANQTSIDKLIELLQSELEQKNKRIEQLEQDLSKAYNQISQLANNASYVTAADKAAQIIDKKAADNTEDQKKRKKWFQFWKQ